MNYLSKALITLSIIVYTVIPPIADLTTDTHVFHEGWMPHARMHTVWLLGVSSGIGMLALYLLWAPGSDRRFRVNLSVLLSSIMFAAFYMSAFTISLYGGALSDMEGGIEQGPLGLDANMFTFTVAAAFLLAGWILSGRSSN
ncbi:MAG: DUF6640 family protein [Pseudomonadota bacterium]